ncbi:hypothetical protein M501DRAFT_1020959 [Patellaria atrata CBS 101060]|uniref:Large ribosomal subunit protein mL67 n=1 Tax=Patellaria atrata CBS 101060 TaxID=1346257 RepID=A0A9P4VM26_9PEZI|nr:hypothetical protein M501DRAFT_1020959 [Patellaria atrata CBS 101060]
MGPRRIPIIKTPKVYGLKNADHGRYIFIYNNVKTNQVVYSLDRALKNSSVLKQLPYAGKKTVPRAVRKDMWRTMATITFPSAPQGLTAYRLLREFRILHETRWRIAEGEKPLPRKLRARKIMNQKANTVADLAAVLQKQKVEGEKMVRMSEISAETVDEAWLREHDKHSSLEALQDSKPIDRMKAVLSSLKKQQDTTKSRGDKEVLTVCIKRLATEIRKQKMWDKMEKLAQRADEGQLQRLKERTKALRGKQSNSDEEEKAKIETLIRRIHGYVNDMARAQKVLAGGRERFNITWNQNDKYSNPIEKAPSLPKYGPIRKAILNPDKVSFTMDGVRIQWADILDAEYAAAWPEEIHHEQIKNDLRHIAPVPEKNEIPDCLKRTLKMEVDTGAETEYDEAGSSESLKASGLISRVKSWIPFGGQTQPQARA